MVNKVLCDLGIRGVGRPLALLVELLAVVFKAGEVGHDGLDGASVDVVVLQQIHTRVVVDNIAVLVVYLRRATSQKPILDVCSSPIFPSISLPYAHLKGDPRVPLHKYGHTLTILQNFSYDLLIGDGRVERGEDEARPRARKLENMLLGCVRGEPGEDGVLGANSKLN